MSFGHSSGAWGADKAEEPLEEDVHDHIEDLDFEGPVQFGDDHQDDANGEPGKAEGSYQYQPRPNAKRLTTIL